jgi:hypothetical protein
VLDDGTLLAELDETNSNLNVTMVKSEMRDTCGIDDATLDNNWGMESQMSWSWMDPRHKLRGVSE